MQQPTIVQAVSARFAGRETSGRFAQTPRHGGAWPGQSRSGPSREVSIRISVKHVININLPEQCFTVRAQFEASWEEPELKKLWRGSGGEFSLSENEERNAILVERDPRQFRDDALPEGDCIPQRLFHPMIAYDNCIHEEENQPRWVEVYEGAKPGDAPTVCLRWVTQGTFQTQLELALFPFDEQDLTMTLRSGCKLAEVHLAEKTMTRRSAFRSYVRVRNFIQNREYRLYKHLEFETARTECAESATGAEYSMIHARMHVWRKPAYWMYNIFWPLFMIASSALTSYSIHPSKFGDRATIDMTVLLAIIGFKYMISNNLPSINYATILDSYVLCCFVFTFFIVVEQALNHRFAMFMGGPHIKVPWMEDSVMLVSVVFIGSWLVGNVLAVVAVVVIACRRGELTAEPLCMLADHYDDSESEVEDGEGSNSSAAEETRLSVPG